MQVSRCTDAVFSGTTAYALPSIRHPLSGLALVRPYLLSFLKELGINKVPRERVHLEDEVRLALTHKFVFHRMRDIPEV